jgi:acetyl-CoA acetyltransferase
MPGSRYHRCRAHARGRHGGALASVRPTIWAAIVLKALIDRTKIDPAIVEEVYFGCANQRVKTIATSRAWRRCWPVSRMKFRP